MQHGAACGLTSFEGRSFTRPPIVTASSALLASFDRLERNLQRLSLSQSRLRGEPMLLQIAGRAVSFGRDVKGVRYTAVSFLESELPSSGLPMLLDHQPPARGL